MAKNYLTFLFGLVILFLFSFCFGYVGIYSENLIAGILAIVGFLASLVISLLIGIASRDEGGSLYLWFFGIAILTAIIFVWYLTRAGTVLQIW
jgi:ABC-type transport system involved in cytochrome c biogenesis permease component